MGVKKLAPAAAYAAWIDLHPLTYTVSDKLKKDHTLVAANLSIAAAVERYEGNPKITTSSWMLLDSVTILNKAKGGVKRACLYNGAQQMAIQLKVKRRTVDIQKIDRKEKQRYRDVMEVEIKGETHYLVCSSDEADVNINVKGGWTQLTAKWFCTTTRRVHFPVRMRCSTNTFSGKSTKRITPLIRWRKNSRARDRAGLQDKV